MLLKIGLAVAVVAVAAVVVAKQIPPPTEVKPADKRFEVKITDEMIRHSRIRDVLYFVSVGWSLGALALLLVTGASRRMRDAAARISKWPLVVASIYIALFVVVTTLIELPLAYYSGFVVPHQFELTDQSLPAWLGDFAKALAVNLVISVPVGAGALWIMRRVKRWWIVLWLASIPLILLMVVVQPLVLDPIFNKFEPLRNEQLRRELLDLASRAGIEGGRVYQVDKSKQTRTMNAYVNGIGPTARIVMWDTLLAKMSEEEVLAVMGHEMGHYVLKHMWKGLAFGLGVSLFVFFVGQKLYERGLVRRGEKWGITGPGDPAALPWLLLVGSVLSLLLSPVISGYSRRIEREADLFSLELTHLNEPMATAFVKFAEDSKRDPSPHPFMEFWLYSHPPIAKRIPFALGYRPWEHGQPNRVWKGGKQ